MFVVTITSPSAGQSVGDNFNVAGNVSDDGTSSGSFASETRQVQSVSVQVGSGASASANSGAGPYSAIGHIPTDTKVGRPLTITVTASGIARDATNTTNTKPISTVKTVSVTAAPTPPVVGFSPFDNDETVARLPFRVPLLAGSTNDLAGVTKVQYTIDDGPRQDMDVVSGTTSVTWSVADVEFGAGQHVFTVIATNVFGQEGSAFTTVTVRVNTPPPLPPSTVNPLGLSFTPTFRHKKWHNNVDLIAAGGPDGFNVRYDAIDNDLRQAATVVDQINTALNQTGIQPGEQVLTPPIDLFSFGSPGSAVNGWFLDSTGVAHADSGSGGGEAVVGLSLPDGVTLTSFRAMGVFSAIRMSITLCRASLADWSQTSLLAQITERVPGRTNPFDLQVPTVAVRSVVDNNRFHYYVLLASDLVGSTDDVSVSTLQLAYTS
ncbi:hypothetical protein [Streptomyces sp. NPDC091215]|uniref:hypothetical protein n=1 Tax=Streptomyces sp. NPDC091215 TaxID=3155192 RepID=UPI00341705C9